ncbi:hypothetical protein Bca4012_009248 [Brassica carinata]
MTKHEVPRAGISSSVDSPPVVDKSHSDSGVRRRTHRQDHRNSDPATENCCNKVSLYQNSSSSYPSPLLSQKKKNKSQKLQLSFSLLPTISSISPCVIEATALAPFFLFQPSPPPLRTLAVFTLLLRQIC